MARFRSSGTVLGFREEPYDFTDEKGESVKGVTVILCLFDRTNTTAMEYKIGRNALGKFDDIAEGETVDLILNVTAQSVRGGGAALAVAVADVRVAGVATKAA